MTWQLASFLVLGLALALGFAWYERSRPPARVLALVAALAALAVVGRLAFAPLPNVKPTTDIVLFAGYALGGAPGFAVGAVTALVSNVFLGHGPWTPWQMAGWGGVGIAGGALRAVVRGWRWRGRRGDEPASSEPRELGRWPLALACGLAGLGFGIVMDVYMWTLAAEQTVASYVAVAARSLPFNVAHIVGNVVFCLLIGPPLVRALRRYRRRFEVRWAPGSPAVTSPAALLVVLGLGLAALAGAPGAQAASSTERAARYLEGSQNRDGGFGADRGSRSTGTQTGDAALGLAAAGRNPQDVSRSGNSIVDWMRHNINGVRNVGGVERTMLVLRAAGLSPRRFAGRNLYRELLIYRNRGEDGSFGGSVNHAAYGVLALRAAGASPRSELVQDSVDWMVRQQNDDPGDDGGFGITAVAPSGTDYTGAALSALGAAGRGDGVAAGRAVEYLRKAQDGSGQDRGGFGLTARGRPNAQSTAWSVQGLVAAGRGSGTMVGEALAYLRRVQAGDGSIPYDSGGGSRVWATGQAEAALKKKPFPLNPVARRPPVTPSPTDKSADDPGGVKGAAGTNDDRPRRAPPREPRASRAGPGNGSAAGSGAGPASGARSAGAGLGAIGTTALPESGPPLDLSGLAGAVGAAGSLATPMGALPGVTPSQPKTPGQLLSDSPGRPPTPVAASKPLGPKKGNPAPKVGAGVLLVFLVAAGLLLATGGGARARRLWAAARRRTS